MPTTGKFHVSRRRAIRGFGLVAGTAVIFLLGACAAPVPVSEARLLPLTGEPHQIQVKRAAVIALSTGRNRPLPAGSRWVSVGTLPQGTVFKPIDTVFVIVGRNVHEAYLVLREGLLHGFYLPGESRYSPLQTPLPLSIGDPS